MMNSYLIDIESQYHSALIENESHLSPPIYASIGING
jgi:hypothetical protein